MPIAKSSMADSVQAGVCKTAQDAQRVGLGGVFTITCFDKEGKVKWEDQFHNLVVNVGLAYLNDTFFEGSGYTAGWYLGLVNGASAPSYSAADTMTSHAGWTELAGGGTTYTGDRKAVSFGAATTANPSEITNSGSPAVFAITATATIAGAFLNTDPTGTGGTLFSAGNFTGGNKSVASGDTVNVTYTFSAEAV